MGDGIDERVIGIVAEHFGKPIGEITLESRFKEDLNADSLDAVEVNMTIEDAYGVVIPDSEAGNMANVGNMVSYVRARYNPKSSQ